MGENILRQDKNFPLIENETCAFLKSAWKKGLLNEYAEEHFLIKAIEMRLEDFIAKEQLIENNLNLYGIVRSDKTINTELFCITFCMNLSCKLSGLSNIFGVSQVESFILNQLSAGKQNYNEDAFFQALSEISVLSFWGRHQWLETIYEPPVSEICKKNPEATFIGEIECRASDEEQENICKVKINVEVKSPAFPHDKHVDERIVIPTVLLSEKGREKVRALCEESKVKYLDPRVLKLRDFLNSASSKFNIPEANEFNILYINWSYRDFPSNSFLEAWSLLTNEKNGVLVNPESARAVGINPDIFEKLSAVIVYTESLEGLMFNDFSCVWQENGKGPRFRMWIINDKIRKDTLEGKTDILFELTRMKSDKQLTQYFMLDYKAKNEEEKIDACVFSQILLKIIENNCF